MDSRRTVCPRCGREQRCGCETCHHCGVPVVSAGGASQPEAAIRGSGAERTVVHPGTGEARRAGEHPVPDGTEGPTAAGAGEEATAGPAYRAGGDGPAAGVIESRERPDSRALTVLGTVLLVLGVGALVITVGEMFKMASGLANLQGGAVAATAGLKRLGYYLGNMMYYSTLRFIVTSALLSAGLLVNPPAPFRHERAWGKTVRATGFLMVAVGALFALALILIIIPTGYLSILVKNQLPPLLIAVPVLLAGGSCHVVGGRLLIAGARGVS